MNIFILLNGLIKKNLRKSVLTIIILSMVTNLIQPQEIKASNNREYLNISLADIIVTWYNASGVAIGNQQLVNEIEALYGTITIDDLIENEVLKTNDLTATKEDIRNAIGYGSVSVPYIKVDSVKLRQYLGDIPTNSIAYDALVAMFDWQGNESIEGIFGALATVIGNVANIGKIGYNVIKDVLYNTVINFPLVQTLKDVYHNFTNSTYFQDLLKEGDIVDTVFDYGEWTILSNITIPEGYQLFFMIRKATGTQAVEYAELYPVHVYSVIQTYGGGASRYPVPHAYNNTDTTKTIYTNTETIVNIKNKTITVTGLGNATQVEANTMVNTRGYIGSHYTYFDYYGPVYVYTIRAINYENIIENDPWGTEGSIGEGGVTYYINNKAGNITNVNYQDLTSNIANNEYMYIFTVNEYNQIINSIENNTENEIYENNQTIINNYNINYMQEPEVIDVRPTYYPAPTGQPIQPFISPRPTPIPEETEQVIYEGGIAESIKDKFPFCIPWDIQEIVINMWSSNRRAPYLHWDANFGSWGKLGEVDIDLTPFDTVAQIFRSTTLILWILGLIIATKNIIG